jgi:hypothetical protein
MAGLPKSLWGEALRHSTWLKNRTSARALGGRTPWQALYGSPPDLSRLKHFGETVWVHDADGSELDPRAREGRWIGFDIESRGHRVYWPVNRTVSVKRNVYFGVAERLEGEQMDVPTSKTFSSEPQPTLSTEPPPSPLSPLPTSSSSSRAVSEEVQLDEPTLEPPVQTRAARTRKPSGAFRELQAGIGVASTRPSDPVIPKGISVPGSFGEEEEAVEMTGGVWSVEQGLPGGASIVRC